MSLDAIPQKIGKRYQLLEKLGAGGMGAVYRAHDILEGQTVALKQVLAPVEQERATPTTRSTDFRLALSIEFRTLASLRHPHIVNVIDYGFDDEHKPYFTMNLVEGAQTLLEAAQDASHGERVRLLVELLQALSYLHRRGILHRDIKPGNVLVDDSGAVKMLDFGLSLATTYSMTNMDSGMAGTLAYMAPELFNEEEATISSDLYAVGVVAYEFFKGERPFDSKNIALLINNILNRPPDFSGIDFEFEPILDRLLAKDPLDRYASAEEVVDALCEAIDYELPSETSAIRESFLQTARLVGRRDELQHLREMLGLAIDGQGCFELIGGESGVGKSRLIDELRVRALVKGILVVRGQAVAEGSTTYHMWRSVLRSLALYSDLIEEEASILKAVVPDIDRLIGQDVEEAPPLQEPIHTQTRLFHTIRALIKRLRQPLLMIFEDLQWAGADSLALLTYCMSFLNETNLMIVADYRNDEKPNLPEILNNPPTTVLERFSQEDIVELSSAMLGDAGKLPHVVELLHRETEGNAYFLVEVVRVLAEEAGQLSQIGEMTLPERVFAGGIQAVIDRRLKRVPLDARPLLQLAAIAGRQLDMSILRALAPERDLDAWLTDCVNAAVLDVLDERWHFAHNRLRDQLIGDIPDTSRPILYQHVARALETAHADNPEYIARLAYLWHVAGEPDKELPYAKMAGLQAFSANSHQEAIAYFRRALELLKQQPENPERLRQELDIQMPLSIALVQTQGFTSEEVEHSWIRSRDLCDALDSPPETLGVLWGLCGMHMIRGENDIAAAMDKEIIQFADLMPFPELTVMQALYTRTINLIAVGQIELALETARECLSYYNPQDSEHAIAMYGSNPGITTKALISSLLQVLGYSEQAQATYDEALAEARSLNHPYTLSTILTFCWIAQLRGDVDAAYQLAAENIALANEYRFLFNQVMGNPVLGWAMAQRGEIEQGIGMIHQAMGMLSGMGAYIMRNYFLGMLAEAFIKLGQNDKAVPVIEEALGRIDTSVDRFYEPEIYRLKGELVWGLEDDLTAAEEYVQKAISISRERNVKWFELRSTICLATMWHAQGKSVEAADMLAVIYNWFTEGLDSADLQQARALLDKLQAS